MESSACRWLMETSKPGSSRSAWEEIRALIYKWRTMALNQASWHTPLGRGYEICADDLDALLARHTPEEMPESLWGPNGRNAMTAVDYAEGDPIRCICGHPGDTPSCPVDHDQIQHERDKGDPPAVPVETSEPYQPR